jgi:4-hydroxy-tetrahydrodipicolinate synthase
MDLRSTLRGVTTPLVTPFDGEEIDEAALEGLIDHVQDGGVDAVFPCGTTGEFPSMTPAEQRRVTEFTVEAADVPVIAGAARTSVEETVEAIDAAADAGADAVAIVPPYFIAANAPEGNRRVFESVLDRASLPVLLYNIPQCTGGRIEPETVAAVADHDRALGLKDSSGDLEYFSAVLRETPEEFLCLQGYDALLVASMRMGGDGGVNALSNAVPEVFREAVDRVDDERGRELQLEAIAPLFEACTDYGFAPAAKSGLVHRGVIPTDDVRPPLVPAPDDAPIGDQVDRTLAVADRS